ncbi:DNA binding domain protein, excisionase family [Desulfofundulus kuznetsovii DSM 6115]|uniref:DNA binding domain protein, excisionase family n=1 Tax=Desulfofundulus kuznetsovii (strain DSM 6115 / VKM B-1805 / 17) TaxID=760568 RepID=A0AAU8PTM0_DESK7|nr:DNA binding domain protein, excisionase family [Desulfofundulus kuznetsovii DSM 6115]
MSERLAYEVKEVYTKILPLGRVTVYELIKSGKLKSIRVGKKILVPAWAIEEFLRETR